MLERRKPPSKRESLRTRSASFWWNGYATGSKQQGWNLRKVEREFPGQRRRDEIVVVIGRPANPGPRGGSEMPEQSADEIFDDASGDVAIGDLDSAVEKYQRC